MHWLLCVLLVAVPTPFSHTMLPTFSHGGLIPRGWSLRRQPADGHCFYHCVVAWFKHHPEFWPSQISWQDSRVKQALAMRGIIGHQYMVMSDELFKLHAYKLMDGSQTTGA